MTSALRQRNKMPKITVLVTYLCFLISIIHLYSDIHLTLVFDVVYRKKTTVDDVAKKSISRATSATATKTSSLSSDSYNSPSFNNRTKAATLCTREQILQGQWVPVLLNKAPYVPRLNHLRCFPNEVYAQQPYKSWSWQIDDASSPACQLTAWDATTFCDLVKYATVSIIGDSLSWEQYSSLLQILEETVHQKDQHRSKTYHRNHFQMGCPGDQTQFVFRNDPRLEFVEDAVKGASFPSVLILNRGAHYVNDTTILSDMERLVEQLRNWQATCDSRKIRCHLFWRTTVPGHPGCEANSKPINNLTEMEATVNDLKNYDNVTIHYHWYDFQHQNLLMVDHLKRAGLDFEVIDAYHINILRPDEHRVQSGDCLHNCYPGKMDVYNQLLLHYLRQQRTEQDVERLEELFTAAMTRIN